jgi:threonylcarbamoyladenosine tRNA methylthiotransferase MtaB
MKRRYRRELYQERVDRIRELLPDACIGVDVIVGFPGESEALFKETYDFLNKLDISYLHIFPYSERANTEAALMPKKVSGAEKAERSKMLHILSEKKRRAFYESQLGKMDEVLFESSVQNGIMEGFTRNYVKVSAKFDPMWVNEEIKGFLNFINQEGHVHFTELPEKPEISVRLSESISEKAL